MKIMVFAPMEREMKCFDISLQEYKASHNGLRHEYQLVNTGVGKVNSAVSATLAVRASRPDMAAVVGYAAGTSNFNRGDYIFPDKAMYHDVQRGIDEPDLEDIYPLRGKDDCTILTGDVFVGPDLAYKLIAEFGKKVLFDMEGTAIAQALRKLDVPLSVMRLVSDIPDSDHMHRESYYEYTMAHQDFTPFVEYLESLD